MTSDKEAFDNIEKWLEATREAMDAGNVIQVSPAILADMHFLLRKARAVDAVTPVSR